MVAAGTIKRGFRIGTTGWNSACFDDARFEKFWESGRFEIVEGVLTEIPAATYDLSEALFNLLLQLSEHVKKHGIGGSFGVEADVILNHQRVARVDATYLTKDDRARQAAMYAKSSKRHPKLRFGRLLLAPTLVIESVSLGHESHDRDTKLNWYAEAGVKHYWILDTFAKTLECYSLGSRGYRLEATGKKTGAIKPSLFPKLSVNMADIWA